MENLENQAKGFYPNLVGNREPLLLLWQVSCRVRAMG